MRELLEAFGLVVLVVLMTFVAAASVRLFVILVVVMLGGCYASHEHSACEVDQDCPELRYCERRFQCATHGDGSVTCDPLRGCAWLHERIDCESPPEGLGLCAPPEARELWR